MNSIFQNTSRQSRRRGVTLLFVIGLITLFVLLGTTFLVVSVHFMRSSRIHNTGTIQWDSPRDQQRTVLYNIVRGTRDAQSSLLTHDLLTDMYDVENTFFGVVGDAYFAGDTNTTSDDTHFRLLSAPGGATPNLGPGLIALQIVPGQNVRQVNYQLSNTTGAYNGQYMTFLDGPTRGTTVQIIEYLVHVDPNVAPASAGPNDLVRQFIVRPANGDTSFFTLQTPSANVAAGGLVNARVLINSRQFNGLGVGFEFQNLQANNINNIRSGRDNAQLQLDALLPNRRDYIRTSVPSPFARVAPRDLIQFYYGDGHANESYDAVDFQNMALSATITDGGNFQIIPSFHRPALVRYWNANSQSAINPVNSGSALNNDPANYAPFHPQQQTNWDPNNSLYPLSYREFRRQIIMRPMPWDHPNFSGGNANLMALDTDGDGTVWDPGQDSEPGIANFDDDGINGTDDPGELGAEGSDDVLDNDAQLISLLDGSNGYIQWDVDNDGDLVPDSIWIDVGLPVQVDKHGRHYKPLAAILISDMDGRLNLNAHGSRWHQDNEYGNFVGAPTTTTDGTMTNSIVHRGQGYGPPEVSLRPIFTNNNDYRRLLFGHSFGSPTPNRLNDLRRGLVGRYGGDQDITAGQNVEPAPGRAMQAQELLMNYKFFDYPQTMVGGSYGNFADPNGRFGIGLNGFGQPIFDVTNMGLEKGNSPYEMNLSHDAARGDAAGINAIDRPFSPAELERVLRSFDGSNGALDDRLVRLSSALRNNANNERLLVTTDSYDVPVPHEGMFDRMNIVEEYRYRLGLNNNGTVRGGTYAQTLQTNGATPVQIQLQINATIREILAPELILGKRMNVNRAFGNGQDDNGNNIIDEHWFPGDWNLSEAYHNNNVPEYIPGTNVPFDHDNDGLQPMNSADRGYLARQMFARHLYTLMMLMVDNNTAMDFDGDNVADRRETPYALAQLAINIVDFRDSDSIMTPFEFDTEPFDADGWSVNMDVRDSAGESDRGVVWGLERPELLITEAFATHDRRTEDLSDFGQVNGGGNNDDDFDQRLRPQGSLFIELYNPWSPTSRPPVELYDNGLNGVDLTRMDRSGTYPVWRVAVARPDAPSNNAHGKYLSSNSRFLDPDAPNITGLPDYRMNPSNLERTVYFANAAPPGVPSGRPYVPTNTVLGNMQPVLPNGYAVVGSSGREVSPTQFVTTFGRRTDSDELGNDLMYPTTRSIILNPGQSVTRIQPSLIDPTQMETQTRNYGTDLTFGIPIPLLSVSEPVNGYSLANFDPGAAAGEGAYMVPLDQPLDEARTQGANPELEFQRDGTHRGYRMLHLQRLANPLAPWDSTSNPYLTIDSAHVDLTIFHGVTNVTTADYGAITTLQTPKTYEFATDERGTREVTQNLPPNRSRQLWPVEYDTNNFADAAVSSFRNIGDMHYHDFHLFESMGQLNDAYRPRNALNGAYVEGPRDLNGGSNPNLRSSLPQSQRDKWIDVMNGQNVAFSWYTFNNRPFISQLEMVMVPRGRSSRTLYDYSLQTAPGGGLTEYDFDRVGARFGHLANFYRSTDDDNDPAPHLYKLFDLTSVPSRFTQSERYLQTNQYQQLLVTINGSQQNNAYIGTLPLNAPFSFIEERREPGKVNINTIFDQRVWQGLMGDIGGNVTTWPGPAWQTVVQSRRGYGGAGQMIQPNPSVPTAFSNPYRDGASGNLVVENTGMNVVRGSEVNVMRPNPNNVQNPLHDSFTNQDFNDADRNAYFKEHSRFRLGNLLTTRSNVYAVWITLGYFEIDPATQQLGQELGADTGNIIRNRSFHIIDRSIPVGFEPGENHNVDKAILVERYIE